MPHSPSTHDRHRLLFSSPSRCSYGAALVSPSLDWASLPSCLTFLIMPSRTRFGAYVPFLLLLVYPIDLKWTICWTQSSSCAYDVQNFSKIPAFSAPALPLLGSLQLLASKSRSTFSRYLTSFFLCQKSRPHSPRLISPSPMAWPSVTERTFATACGRYCWQGWTSCGPGRSRRHSGSGHRRMMRTYLEI